VTIVEQLHHLHEQMRDFIRPWNEMDTRRQWHRELSPALWHVGHVAVTESFWLQEVVLGEPIPQDWKKKFFPEATAKPERSARLSDKEDVLAFCQVLALHNLALLDDLLMQPQRHPLLAHAYLGHFLLQHIAQHLETLTQIAVQRSLHSAPAYRAHRPLAPDTPTLPERECAGGEKTIGDADDPRAYDNERPRHRERLDAFRIAARPVSNAEYLGFMQSGGYEDERWWSGEGLRWCETTRAHAPQHWRRDDAGQWYGVGGAGPVALAPREAVEGIGYYEAQAFARYCGCRLPTETEWEHAAASGAIADTSIGVWEWCANAFYPYPGFRPFPYERYSLPWFDGEHKALRGGSRHTHACIKRRTFRNFYTPDKRHIFAGLRLACDTHD